MSALFRELAGRRPAASAVSAAASRAASASLLGPKSLFVTLNKSPSKCEWDTRKGIKPCEFPKYHTVEGLPVITLPAGTKIYHSTAIMGKEKEWFKNDLASSRKPYMWFASTRDHAEVLQHTHLLEYTVNKDIELAYIHNLPKHAHVTRGKEYMKSMFEVDKARYAEKGLEIEGYAGCNECEYLLLKCAYEKLSGPVLLVEKAKYVDGGARATRKRSRKSRTRRRVCRNK